MMFNNNDKRQPPKPTKDLEAEISNVIASSRHKPEEVKSFAPSVHPDRISQATKAMVDTIDRLYETTAEGIDHRVAEFTAKVEELQRNAAAFKHRMRTGANDLIKQVTVLGTEYEDIANKLRNTELSTPLTKLLPTPFDRSNEQWPEPHEPPPAA